MKTMISIIMVYILASCDSDEAQPVIDLSGSWSFLGGGIGDIGFYLENGASASFSFDADDYNIDYFLPLVDNGVYIDTLVRIESGKFQLLNTTYTDGRFPNTTIGWNGDIEFSTSGGVSWLAYFRTIEKEDRMSLEFLYEGQSLTLMLER